VCDGLRGANGKFTDTPGFGDRSGGGRADNSSVKTAEFALHPAACGCRVPTTVRDFGSDRVNENKPADDAHAQRRRRVLRGALSAPVVLTISNGAGAQVLSNLRCVNHQVNNAPLPRTYAAGEGVPSTVIRVQLYRDTDNTKRFFSGTELQGLAHPSRPVSWISNGQWQEFNTGTNLRVGVPYVPSPTPVPTSPIEYANVQMDQDGYILSVGTNSTNSTSLIAATCWNSFRAGPV